MSNSIRAIVLRAEPLNKVIGVFFHKRFGLAVRVVCRVQTSEVCD